MKTMKERNLKMTPNDKKFVAFVATVVLIFTAALVVKEVARINPIDQVESERGILQGCTSTWVCPRCVLL